jgi:1-pyrroline-5-carboxylate dehydrogenase
VRWVSPRAIKETFVPARDYRYPFLQPDEDAAAQVAAGGNPPV